MTASVQESGAVTLDAAPDAMPTMSSTASEIRAYAEVRGIEVPSRATKAQMLAAIEGVAR